jgi:hypothetical protein
MRIFTVLFSVFFSVLIFFSFPFILVSGEGLVLNTSEPSVGPPPFEFFDDHSAVTAYPVHLYRGAVIENVHDLSLETPISTWTNKRSYDSGLSIGAMGHEHSAPLGHRWRGDGRKMTLQKRGDNIELVMTGSNRELFTASENGFISPANFNAALELVGKDTEEEKYVLTRNATGEIFIFYGFSKPVPVSVRGKLHERSNNYYYAQGLVGETYSYDSRGLVELIVTASPQAYAIRYTYNMTGIAVNRLHKIEVFDSLKADDSSKKLSEVVFTYWEEISDAHNDVGDFGDLVQVKVSKLLSDNISYQTRITQYRYHRTDINNPNTDIDDGISHQLKLVLELSAIERLLSENSELTKPEDILKNPIRKILATIILFTVLLPVPFLITLRTWIRTLML